MIKKYCDFCKKEAENLKNISRTYPSNYPPDFDYYELCLNCYSDFKKFEKDHRDKLNNELNTYVNMHLA